MAKAGVLNLGLPSSARFDSLDAWFAALTQPTALTELAALLACVLLAWLVTLLAHRARRWANESSILFGRRLVDGVLFPLLLLSLAYAAQALLAPVLPLAVFKVAIPVLLAGAFLVLPVMVMLTLVAGMHSLFLYNGGLRKILGVGASEAPMLLSVAMVGFGLAAMALGAIAASIGLI